jgi:cyclopropane-fatty-acyl-phospholipid synthase
MVTKPSVADTLSAVVTSALGTELPVRLRAWDGSETGPAGTPCVVLRSRRALRHILWSPGELGLARAYVAGDLDVEGDVEDGFHLVWAAARDRGAPVKVSARARLDALRDAIRLGAIGLRPPRPAPEARPVGRLHSRRRDRAAIAHHYDLSNDFYALILDESMAYSCAYWPSDSASFTLADAQRAKLDLVCRKLGIQPGMRLLDVGCGWGSLSIHAAREFGAQVTGVTLSQQQLDFVRKRVADAGLHGQVEVRLQDYRDLDDGPYDAVASIEMGEHVGATNYPTFTATLARLLRPQGRVLVQQMSRRGAAPGGGPFIEAYIAPDMHMRPVGETVALIEDAGLEVRDVEAMREHYVRTARAWLATLETQWDAVVDLVGVEMARVWRLYMVGGIVAFDEGRMGVDQILAVKTESDGKAGMPPTRATWT